jgi:hypothetical protein
MPKRSSKKKLPADANQRAKAIVEAATSSANDGAENEKNPAAVALGRLGGLKGGKARAAKLSAKKRSQIARNAAVKRWGGTNGK